MFVRMLGLCSLKILILSVPPPDLMNIIEQIEYFKDSCSGTSSPVCNTSPELIFSHTQVQLNSSFPQQLSNASNIYNTLIIL
ncbi:uncharacterized protein RAG0_00078 [Rhynchosporium agropyri]|uniref:Uncharacterized protein n=1 Tax=Rhynchosporium agropyri TaxID=914238 RepID=A0A1E1JVR6_9HELO|nr:uncharacterized protein RAG0_00078 [Rhynchosporium agropyri]